MPKKKTTEEIDNFLSSKNLIRLGDYINVDTHLHIKNLKCNHEYDMSFSHIRRNYGCPICSKRKKKTTDEFRKYVSSISDEYEFIGVYKSVNTKAQFYHKACNNYYFNRPEDFIMGGRCPICAKNKLQEINNKKRKTAEEFKNEIISLTNNEYNVLGNYVNNKIKIEFIHLKCKNKFLMKPNAFLGGCRCPICKASHGETIIKNILDENNIEYEFQKKFTGCIDKKELPFDFYIPIINTAIEFDGEQHFTPVNFGGGMPNESFKLIKKHDEIKNTFCYTHNIDLLRISYKDINNIENIVTEKIIKKIRK